MTKHVRGVGVAGRLAAMLAVAVSVLGGDVGRADAADPPNGLTGAFGQNSSSAQVVPGTGAMTYSVPFHLPAARGSAQPSLGLRYASGAGTQEAGEDWSVDLPSIERAPLSGWPKYVDNGVPAAEDRYTYSGRPLTFVCVVGGSPACSSDDSVGPMPGWASGHRHYRLQVEGSFERFFLSADRQRWIVQRRGGEILELGAPLTRPTLGTGGRDIGQGTASVFRWNLVRQRDLHGDKNLIVYAWAGTAPARQYLSHIYYSPKAGGGATLDDYAYHVELRWEAPAYRQYDYTRMDKRRQVRRLQRVAVASKTWSNAANRELVRAYTLGYYADRALPTSATQAPLFGKSALKRVTMEGECGVSEASGTVPYPSGCPALPAVTFEYQPATLATGVVATRSAIAGSIPIQGTPATGLPRVMSTVVFDVDRDGLPDIVEGWPQNIGATGPRTYECNFNNEHIQVQQSGGYQAPLDPQLVCPSSGVLRSARELNAYLNGGAGASGLAMFHNCVDAGDGSHGTLTGYHIENINGWRNAALFTPFDSAAIGAWGDASMLWSIAGYTGFSLRIGRVDPSFCPNVRGNPTAIHSALKWTQMPADANSWAKYPDSSATIPYHTMVDLDGDGYEDLLTDPSAPASNGYFKRSSVRFSTKLSHLETVPGMPGDFGPALVPFASGAGSSTAISIAPTSAQSFSTYVDINGDGIVDLVTARNTING